MNKITTVQMDNSKKIKRELPKSNIRVTNRKRLKKSDGKTMDSKLFIETLIYAMNDWW